MSLTVKVVISLVVLVLLARVAATVLELTVLPPGAIAGIVIGILSVGFIAVAAWFLVRVRRG